MNEVLATLKKRVTSDGHTSVRDDLELGRTYIVYPQTKRLLLWGQAGSSVEVMRESIYVFNADDNPSGGWMPTELLEIFKTQGEA